QLTFKIRQVQKAGIASCPDDDDTLIEVSGRAQFKGILTSVLRRGGTTYDRRAVRIKHIKVIIVGRGTERIRPKKDYWPTWQRHRFVISSSEAVDVSTLSIDRSTSRAAVDKISFPGSRGPVFVVPDVANRGEVQRTTGRYGIDRSRNYPVLKWRFTQIPQVINDDITTGRTQIQNILSEIRRSSITCGEK